VLCVALGVATMSIVLKLYYPDQFRRWKEAPVAFVYRHATEQANEIMHRP